MTFATKTRRAAILSHLLFSLPLAAGLLGSAIPASAQTSLDSQHPLCLLREQSACCRQAPTGFNGSRNYFLSIRNVKTASTVVVMIYPEKGGAS